MPLGGKKFGSWTVIEISTEKRGTNWKWVCECECGTIRAVSGSSLTGGVSKSCGCKQGENEGRRKGTKGTGYKRSISAYSVYSAWQQTKNRCYNPKNKHYKYYGGRGITIYPEWRDSFEAFYSYMGERPTPLHSIDRIDNNGNYEPGNVRWATPSQQAKNKRKRIKA